MPSHPPGPPDDLLEKPNTEVQNLIQLKRDVRVTVLNHKGNDRRVTVSERGKVKEFPPSLLFLSSFCQFLNK